MLLVSNSSNKHYFIWGPDTFYILFLSRLTDWDIIKKIALFCCQRMYLIMYYLLCTSCAIYITLCIVLKIINIDNPYLAGCIVLFLHVTLYNIRWEHSLSPPCPLSELRNIIISSKINNKKNEELSSNFLPRIY